jgi:transposase InsO family protein
LNDLFTRRGVPGHIRSDSGPEFAAKTVRDWLGRLRVRTLFIGPGSPCEIGHIESFNEKVRDEFLNPEVFTLLEARVLTERWRRAYNAVRPHSSLGYRPPAPGGYSRRHPDHPRPARQTPNIAVGSIRGSRSDRSDAERR